MAISVWSAKVLRSSICRSGNGSGLDRQATMPPMGCPSRSTGTATTHRIVPVIASVVSPYSGSFCTSGMWTIARSRSARPIALSRPGGRGNDRAYTSTPSGVRPCWASRWTRLTVELEHPAELAVAQLHGVLGDHVEDPLHVGRARDRPDDLGCRRILRPGVGELPVAFLQLLDDDRGLDGERLEGVGLRARESPRVPPADHDDTDRGTIPDHWRGDQAARPDRGARPGSRGPGSCCARAGPSRRRARRFQWPVPGDEPDLIAVLPIDEGFGGPGQTGGGLGEDGERRLPVAGAFQVDRHLSSVTVGECEGRSAGDDLGHPRVPHRILRTRHAVTGPGRGSRGNPRPPLDAGFPEGVRERARPGASRLTVESRCDTEGAERLERSCDRRLSPGAGAPGRPAADAGSGGRAA